MKEPKNITLFGVMVDEEALQAMTALTHTDEWNRFVKLLEGHKQVLAMKCLRSPRDELGNSELKGMADMIDGIASLKSAVEIIVENEK